MSKNVILDNNSHSTLLFDIDKFNFGLLFIKDYLTVTFLILTRLTSSLTIPMIPGLLSTLHLVTILVLCKDLIPLNDSIILKQLFSVIYHKKYLNYTDIHINISLKNISQMINFVIGLRWPDMIKHMRNPFIILIFRLSR